MSDSNKPKLMWQGRSSIRALHYSYETEKTYAYWIKKHTKFGSDRPQPACNADIEGYIKQFLCLEDCF